MDSTTAITIVALLAIFGMGYVVGLKIGAKRSIEDWQQDAVYGVDGLNWWANQSVFMSNLSNWMPGF
jgi:hypothetical protein